MKQKILLIVLVGLVLSMMAEAETLSGDNFVLNIVEGPSSVLNSDNLIANVVYGNYFDLSIRSINSPKVNITYPLHDQAINGSTSLNWTTTDMEGDNWLTNITLLNGTLLASGLYMNIANYTINTSQFPEGLNTFVVTSCENESIERLCGNDTRRVDIKNVVIDSEYIGIAIMFFGVTLIFTVLTIISQTIMWKFIWGIATLFLIVADFMVGRMIVYLISPQSSGIISVLDNQYFIWLRFLLVAIAGSFVTIIYTVGKAIKNAAQFKRDQRSQEFEEW